MKLFLKVFMCHNVRQLNTRCQGPGSVLTIKYAWYLGELYDYQLTRLQNDFSYGLNGSRSCCICKLHVLSVGVPASVLTIKYIVSRWIIDAFGESI